MCHATCEACRRLHGATLSARCLNASLSAPPQPSLHRHLSCAEARAPPGAAEPEAPVCKHWRSRGLCCYGDSCVFRHPPECLAALRQRRAEDAARAAATTRSLPAGGRRPGQRRAQSKNRFRASSFRRFLLDTFGRERLGAGAGVLDVAGGKGELAFELVNLNACPATVLEPRPLELHKRVGWLLVRREGVLGMAWHGSRETRAALPPANAYNSAHPSHSQLCSSLSPATTPGMWRSTPTTKSGSPAAQRRSSSSPVPPACLPTCGWW